MIRINLLADGKKAVTRKRRPQMQLLPEGQDRSQLFLSGGLLLALAAFALTWYIYDSRVKAKDGEIRIAEAEVQRLETIIQEVEDFKLKKAELEHKIQVINQLKQNQRGPVRVMDQISRALPELLWLDSMSLAGNGISLSGQAFNTNAVAAFIDNLDRVPDFEEPILRDTRQAGPVYSFNITFGFNPAGPGAAPPAAPAGG
jgi:type IV pilus assembly protein PilN